jgi:hypothetical protein
MRERMGRIVAIASVAVVAAAAIGHAAPRNGGFESGSLKPWKVKDPGGGNWYVYKGRTIVDTGPGPIRGLGGGAQFYRPPRGRYAAAAWQSGPGLNILHRVVRLKDNAVNKLSFFLAWRNSQDRFYTPDSFDYGGGPVPRGIKGPPPEGANQQFRIDLLKRRAPVDTLKKKHILATLFKVKPGTDRARRYKRHRYNLTRMGIEGKVRFRVAEVDNLGGLPVGIDQLKLRSKPQD